MVNKYFLYKMILENQTCVSELHYEPNMMDKLINSPKPTPTQEVLYNDRVMQIMCFIDNYIDNIETLTGHEAKSLILQRDNIIKSLTTKWESTAEVILNYEKRTFKEALESQFEVTLEHIYDYEKAEQQLTGEREVTVILDGNKTELIVDGKRHILKTIIADNQVTLEKCKEIVENLKMYNCYPKKLKFLLSIYTKSEGNEFGDFPEECLLNRTVNYNVEQNKLTVWENDYPVYENINGVICNDKVALADCYM